MPARSFPGLGIKGGYADAESGWGSDMNANLLKLSVLVQAGANAFVAALPGSPAQGDVYVLTTDKSINAYDNGAWVAFVPLEGWEIFDRDQNKAMRFDGSAWAEVTSGSSGGGGGEYPANLAHKYWRIFIPFAGNNNFGFYAWTAAEIQFRARPGGADQATGGAALASSEGGGAASNAFDDDPSTFWGTAAFGENQRYPSQDYYVGYNFSTPVKVGEIAITARSDSNTSVWQQTPLYGTVQFSDDGSTWTDAFTYDDRSISLGNGNTQLVPNPLYGQTKPGASLPSLVGNAGKALFVNSTEDGVEWDTVAGGGGGNGGGGALVPIATLKLTAGQPTLEFANIPQTYKNLRITGVIKGPTNSNTGVSLRFNGDAGNNYEWQTTELAGGGLSGRGGQGGENHIEITRVTPGVATPQALSMELFIPRYAETDFYKNVHGVARSSFGSGGNGGTAGFSYTQEAVWQNTAAINTVTLYAADGSNFAVNSELTLWGEDATASAGGGGSGKPWYFDPPKAADFTFTSGDATNVSLTDDSDAGLLFNMNTPVGGDIARFASKAIPDGDFDIAMRYEAASLTQNYAGFGIVLFDDVANKIMMFGQNLSGNGNTIILQNRNLASYSSAPFEISTVRPRWFRVARVGSTLNFYYGDDGKSWELAGTISETSWLTNGVKRIGFGGSYNRTVGKIVGSVQCFGTTKV